MNSPDTQNKKPFLREVVEGANALSLGISMVVAVLMGVGIGIWLKNMFDSVIFLWLGIVWGVGGAILNVYKVYKKQMKEYEAMEKDPKYSYKKQN